MLFFLAKEHLRMGTSVAAQLLRALLLLYLRQCNLAVQVNPNSLLRIFLLIGAQMGSGFMGRTVILYSCKC